VRRAQRLAAARRLAEQVLAQARLAQLAQAQLQLARQLDRPALAGRRGGRLDRCGRGSAPGLQG